MTPALIRARLLKVQQAELRRILEEIQVYPPVNGIELIASCREIHHEQNAALQRLQSKRSAVSAR